jgi:hypothetical protein
MPPHVHFDEISLGFIAANGLFGLEDPSHCECSGADLKSSLSKIARAEVLMA